MKRIAAALMLAACTSAQAQTYNPVEILPTDIPVATPITQPTPTNLGDDATRQVDLGFTFTYFGQDFTSAWISSNGFLSFQSSANLCCNGQPLEQAQRNTIYQYWTDLINWTGTPYYSKQKLEDGTDSFRVGWYDTYEYGGNRRTSFEMSLYDNGGITFNYIDTYDMQHHIVTAGLTGPTATDNILLFYGQNTSSLSQKAYSFNYETGTVTVDCSVTPMDPSCPTAPVVVPGVPSVTPEVSPTETVVDTVATTTEQVVQTTPEEIQQVVETTQTSQEQAVEEAEQVAEQTAAVEQQVAEQQTAAVATTATAATATRETTSTRTAERLNPTQLAALNSGGTTSSDSQQSSAVSTSDAQQSGDASAKSSMQLFTNASNSSIAMAEAEQQQQLQSSMDSSSASAQFLAGSEQSGSQESQIASQGASGTDMKSGSTSYQDQQKMASIDSANRDSSTSVQQILQPEQAIVEVNQQYSTGSTQQVEEDKNTMVIVQVETQQSSVASTEGRWQESLASQAAALEALNTISNNNQSNGDSQESGSSLGEGQAEVISQMAYVAGFSAYKLVTLPDRPDFYKPRRIYRNNRPVDAYMSIFKMTAANDSLWKQMVESQYE